MKLAFNIFRTFFWISGIFMLFSSAVSAQAPGWVWGRTTNENVQSSGNSVCVDALGNCYVAGYFHGPSVTFGTTILTCNGPTGYSLYLVKYGPAGNVIWARNAGGNSDNMATAIAIDGSGNVFIAGYFGDTIVFGSTILINNGAVNLFIAKYNSAGTALWATKIAECQVGSVRSIATDIFGNCYVAGAWQAKRQILAPLSLRVRMED